jgi:hypothetical protein
MSRNLLIILQKCVSFYITLVLLAPFTPITTHANPFFAAADAPQIYRIAPSTGRPGTYEVLISSNDPSNCKANKELSKASLLAPQGSSIQVRDTTRTDDCSITAVIHIPPDAPIGKVMLWVAGEQNKILGTAEFTITEAVPAGQIPPGVNPPAVDLMWSVMPRNVVGHNFGKSIADNYYAIEIIIGNNSAYNLQIVSVGFQLPSDTEIEGLLARNAVNKALKKGGRDTTVILEQQQQGTGVGRDTTVVRQKSLSPIYHQRSKSVIDVRDRNALAQMTERRTVLPSSSYRITRGTLESRQMFHPRTLVLSTITALGPVLTGFIPYFHNVNHRANFSEGVNILSNPLEKGLELVWPDTRPRQRERFDDQVLRDGLIIRNNTQIRTLAFFPKELLRLPGNLESDAEYKAWRNNAREVRERLGEIVIIGDLIQYVNRISLTPNAPGPLAAPPTIIGIDIKSLRQNQKDVTITIQGANLQGAQLAVSGTTGINIVTRNVDPNGRFITAEVDVEETVPPGTYSIIVTTPASGGRDEHEFTITPEAFEVNKEIKYLPEQPKQQATEHTIDIEISGRFLHNAEVVPVVGAANGLRVIDTVNSKDGKKINARVVIPANATAGNNYKLAVRDRNNSAAESQEIPFEILAP